MGLLSGPVAAAPAGVTIQGKVVDGSGRALAGVPVTLYPADAREPLTTETDADGSFAFTGLTPGVYGVEATWQDRIGHGRWGIEVQSGTATVNLVLDAQAEDGGVRGHIRADAGASLEVRFGRHVAPGVGFDEWWVRPGASGAYEIGLPAGEYALFATASLGGRTLEYQESLTLRAGQVKDADITLFQSNPSLAQVHGRLRVTSPDVEVLGVSVQTVGEEVFRAWSVRFDADQRPNAYTIPNLPAGSYIIEVELWDRSLPDDLEIGWYSYQQRVEVGDRQSVEVDFDHLAPAAVVRGRVVDPAGRPVAGAQFVLTAQVGDGDFGFGYGGTTGQDGKFAMATAEGAYRLEVWIPDGNLSYAKELTLQAGERLDLGDVRLQEDEEGEPVPEPGGEPEVIGAEELRQLAEGQPSGPAVAIDTDAPAVVLPADAAAVLHDEGKSRLVVRFGSMTMDLAIANLDPDRLAWANPPMAEQLRQSLRGIEVGVFPAEASFPEGLQALSGGFRLRLGAILDGDRTATVAVFPEPIRVRVAVDAGGERASLATLWRLDGDGIAAAPSRSVGGELTALVRRSGVYGVAVRQHSFRDVAGHWAAWEIGLAFACGIVNGKTPNVFAPSADVTRAEFAAMLVRSLGLEADPAGAGRFRDVPAKAWYVGVVGAALASGIVKGTSETTFTPGAPITRLQLTVMIGRALRLQGYRLEGSVDEVLARYQDARQVGSWAREDLALAIQEGIVKGVSETRLDPHVHATRAQVAVMLVRLLDVMLAEE
ncbi:MAG: hypothetical protein DIU76_02345 [Bacillota bacterium]|nr:MAG: hypothetical protein DIU76_02345 [Bacillota bacterium]